MNKNNFQSVAMNENNPLWEKMTERAGELEKRDTEVRSPFARDYTRILHSTAYRRLKHKTQVFYNIDNDHVCTRIEHVAHVESVSNTIARELGLNEELTRAIAIGHDLGHAPFGHVGENIINRLRKKYEIPDKFWHEKNSVYFADNFELLRDSEDKLRNLYLTYAVRDGIISHCGEIDQNNIKPRTEFGDLYLLEKGKFNPGTWEACVVKVSDKIAYLGRDIEDAKCLNILDDLALDKLMDITNGVINTTNIIGEMVADICHNSSPDEGICFSKECERKINEIKKYNYTYIYGSETLQPFVRYAELVLGEIAQFLDAAYDNEKCEINWNYFERKKQSQRLLIKNFVQWLVTYADASFANQDLVKEFHLDEYVNNCNKNVYGTMNTRQEYDRAILDFISGMTDRFAIEGYEELLKY